MASLNSLAASPERISFEFASATSLLSCCGLRATDKRNHSNCGELSDRDTD
jgi:hypothetical protein